MDNDIVNDGTELAQQLEINPPPPPEWVDWINSSYTTQEAFDARSEGINQDKFLRDNPDATPLDILHHGRSFKNSHVLARVINGTLDHVIAKLNDDHAATLFGGKPAVIREHVDASFGHETFDIMTQPGMKKWFENVPAFRASVNGDNKLIIKQVNLSDAWWKWPDRRQFPLGIVMAPNQELPGAYNIFQGFPIKPKRGCWTMLKRIIRECICNGDRKLYIWVMDWMADAIQNPAERHGVALVMRGARGIGKGEFAKWFGKLFGQHYLHITQERHLTGNFNWHMASSLMVFADELIWGGNKQTEGVLKALITEDSMMLERKGFDAQRIKNHVRLMVASNEDWAVPAGAGERRWCVCDCSDKFKNDYGFFAALKKEMENGGLEAMMHELSKREISTNQRNAPKTAALKEIALKGFKPEQRWLYDALESGTLAIYTNLDDKHLMVERGGGPWPAMATADELHGEFLSYCENNKIRDRMEKSAFMCKLKALLDLEKPTRTGAKRSRYYRIPPLDEAREIFAKNTQLPMEWED